MKHLLRWAAFALVIWNVRGEAGPWTAVFGVMLFLQTEASGFLWRQVLPGLATLRAARPSYRDEGDAHRSTVP